MLTGTFTPSPEAASLTRAAHMNSASTPVTVRFSNSTGVPLIPDNDPNANPRGCAIRFHLAEHVHTDIVSHSTDGFPARTGQEFLEFLHAIAASSDPSQPHPWPVEVYVGSHPAALAFVQAPKPAPSSFARETYFGVTAMHFTNKDGASRYGRYRIVPEAGNDHLDDATVAARDARTTSSMSSRKESLRALSSSASSFSWPTTETSSTMRPSTGPKTERCLSWARSL